MNGMRRPVGSFWRGSVANAMAYRRSPRKWHFRSARVISLSGDGGFTVLMGDFLSLAQFGLPVKLVAFYNGALTRATAASSGRSTIAITR
jgi:pyruvate dehydrogenase (quinone)